MDINRNNYEIYFLDYLEGRLLAYQQEAFRAFLSAHPDLRQELEEVHEAMGLAQQITDHQAEQIFDQKTLLKKNESNITGLSHQDELLVKQVEGALSPQEALELNRLLENDRSVQQDLAYYKRAKLMQSSEVFDAKSRLKFPETLTLSDHPDYSVIAAVEGDLSDEEQRSFDLACASSDSLRQMFVLYSGIKLKPDDITFEAKDSLRRREAVILPLRRAFYYVSAAAAVIVFMMWVLGPGEVSSARIAHSNPRDTEVNTPSDAIVQIERGEEISIETETAHRLLDRSNRSVNEALAHQARQNNIGSSSNNEVEMAIQEPTLQASGNERILNNNKQIETELVITPMQEVYASTSSSDTQLRQPKTILSFLGEKAEQKLEHTHVYSFVERNAQSLSAIAKGLSDQVKVERVAKNEREDELKVKLGPVEWKSSVEKRTSVESTGKSKSVIARMLSKLR